MRKQNFITNDAVKQKPSHVGRLVHIFCSIRFLILCGQIHTHFVQHKILDPSWVDRYAFCAAAKNSSHVGRMMHILCSIRFSIFCGQIDTHFVQQQKIYLMWAD
jgi:hypothetical protein